MLWVKGSMTRTNRAHQRPSPFRPWARRLCNSHMLAGPLLRMDTTTWVNSNKDHGVSLRTTARPRQDHRGKMTSPTNVACRLTAYEVGANAVAHTFIDSGLGPRALIGGRAANAQRWLAERMTTVWLPKMAADLDNLPAGCHQNNSTDLHLTHSDILDDSRWGS